jgi:holo-[acyl-carrier protein] synthase
LAARFAAKEAAIKALRLANEGVSWLDIEVCKLADGDCELALHGKVAVLAGQMGVEQIALSLSHDGDYAGAFVTVLSRPQENDQKV